MPGSPIAVVGLGPGQRRLLTVEALEALHETTHLYLYTARSPILDEVRDDLRPGVLIHSFDALRDAAASYNEACARIAETLLAAAEAGPLVYAVPGHPLVDDRSVSLLLDGARARGLHVCVVAGLSLLESARGALRLEGNAGIQVVDAADVAPESGVDASTVAERGLTPLWMGQSIRLLNAQSPLLVNRVDDGRLLSRVVQWLLERYPSEHEVTLVSWSGPSGLPTMAVGPLNSFKPEVDYDLGPSVLYVPSPAPLDDARAPATLGYITARLRGPGGCPWDREQTHASLTTYMIEEAYEAVDAVERGDDADLVEELGDVLLQVVLHSQLAEEEGRFSLADVAEAINRKLVRRHPHVFGDVSVSGSSEVLRNWEKIKRAEKGERRSSALDGIPPALPALVLAQTIGRKAAKLGFDWPDVEGTFAKVREELDEIHDAADADSRREEMGDLLYALTSVCRHLGIDAEDALRAATRKFAARFRRVEAYARERHLDLVALDLPGLDALWEEAKSHD